MRQIALRGKVVAIALLLIVTTLSSSYFPFDRVLALSQVDTHPDTSSKTTHTHPSIHTRALSLSLSLGMSQAAVAAVADEMQDMSIEDQVRTKTLWRMSRNGQSSRAVAAIKDSARERVWGGRRVAMSVVVVMMGVVAIMATTLMASITMAVVIMGG